MFLTRGNIQGEVLYFWRIITWYGACVALLCAGSLLPAAPPCFWFVGSFSFFFLCFFSKPPCAAPNAHNPAKIRAISLWEDKALLVPVHYTQT